MVRYRESARESRKPRTLTDATAGNFFFLSRLKRLELRRERREQSVKPTWETFRRFNFTGDVKKERTSWKPVTMGGEGGNFAISLSEKALRCDFERAGRNESAWYRLHSPPPPSPAPPWRTDRQWRGQFVKGNSGQLMVSTFDVSREKWWRTLINCACQCKYVRDGRVGRCARHRRAAKKFRRRSALEYQLNRNYFRGNCVAIVVNIISGCGRRDRATSFESIGTISNRRLAAPRFRVFEPASFTRRRLIKPVKRKHGNA